MATAYGAWVAAHPATARQVEEAVRTLALLVPGGVGEVAYSAAAVLSLLNDAALRRGSGGKEGEGVGEARARSVITALASLDIVLELAVRRLGGRRARYGVLLVVEAVRAAARLYLLAAAPGQLQVGGGGMPPEEPPAAAGVAGGEDGADSGEGTSSRAGRLGDGVAGEAATSPRRQHPAASTAPAATTHYWRAALSGVALPLPAAAAAALAPPSPPSPPASPLDRLAALARLVAAGVAVAAADGVQNPTARARAEAAPAVASTLTAPSLVPNPPSPPSTTLPGEAAAAPAGHAHGGGAAVPPGFMCVPSPPPGAAADTSLPSGSAGGGGSLVDATEAVPLRALGEVLHILRPLVYLLARAALGGRSWFPLLASIACDAAGARATRGGGARAGGGALLFLPPAWRAAGTASDAALRAALASLNARVFGARPLPLPPAPAAAAAATPAPTCAFPNPPDQIGDGRWAEALGSARAGGTGALLQFGHWLLTAPPGSSPAEEAEVRRRRLLWALYFLRSPLYGTVTDPAVRATATATAWLPLASPLLAYARDVLAYLHAHYSFTSGSQ